MHGNYVHIILIQNCDYLQVSLISRLNAAKPQVETIFSDSSANSLSIDAWDKKFIIGSSKLNFKSLEGLKKIRSSVYDNFLVNNNTHVAQACMKCIYFVCAGQFLQAGCIRP